GSSAAASVLATASSAAHAVVFSGAVARVAAKRPAVANPERTLTSLIAAPHRPGSPSSRWPPAVCQRLRPRLVGVNVGISSTYRRSTIQLFALLVHPCNSQSTKTRRVTVLRRAHGML